jgi:hypothetical protein
MEILKFGKFKGTKLSETPQWYQDWLLKQDWFKKDQDNLQIAQKQFSRSAEKIKGWDGYSSKGQAVYDSMFEAEKAIDNAIFNSHDEHSPYWDGVYSWER